MIREWATITKKILLIKEDCDLKWLVINKTSGEKRIIYAINDLNHFKTYQRFLTKDESNLRLFRQQAKHVRLLASNGNKQPAIEWLRTIPIEQRILFFKETYLHEVYWSEQPHEGVDISLKFISAPSRYDNRVMLTRDNWTVTILCRTSKDTTCAMGHSVIAYEGLIDGKSFVHYAHLVEDTNNPGMGKVLTVKNRVLDERSTIAQSQTWKRSSYLVTLMEDKIEGDIKKQKNGNAFVFSALGRSIIGAFLYSIPNLGYVIGEAFTGRRPPLRHSCYSWVSTTVYVAHIDASSSLCALVPAPILGTVLLKT